MIYELERAISSKEKVIIESTKAGLVILTQRCDFVMKVYGDISNLVKRNRIVRVESISDFVYKIYLADLSSIQLTLQSYNYPTDGYIQVESEKVRFSELCKLGKDFDSAEEYSYLRDDYPMLKEVESLTFCGLDDENSSYYVDLDSYINLVSEMTTKDWEDLSYDTSIYNHYLFPYEINNVMSIKFIKNVLLSKFPLDVNKRNREEICDALGGDYFNRLSIQSDYINQGDPFEEMYMDAHSDILMFGDHIWGEAFLKFNKRLGSMTYDNLCIRKDLNGSIVLQQKYTEGPFMTINPEGTVTCDNKDGLYLVDVLIKKPYKETKLSEDIYATTKLDRYDIKAIDELSAILQEFGIDPYEVARRFERCSERDRYYIVMESHVFSKGLDYLNQFHTLASANLYYNFVRKEFHVE